MAVKHHFILPANFSDPFEVGIALWEDVNWNKRIAMGEPVDRRAIHWQYCASVVIGSRAC
jgi:hypothetical protein